MASEGSAPAPKSTGLTKRAVWTLIVAIVVAALLSGVFAYLQYWAPIKVTIHAENNTIDAGGVLNLTVSVKKGLRSIDDTNGVSYRWEVEPATLGSFFLRGERTVNFTAGDDACNGTITCMVEYKGESAMDTLHATVKPAYLRSVSVTPSSISFYAGTWRNITATAFDSIGREMPNASILWSVGGSVNLELNVLAGRYCSVVCRQGEGNATVVATATAGGFMADASVPVLVGPVPKRTVEYRWYDMFNVPFGGWYDMRWEGDHNELPLSDTYPYILKAYRPPPGTTKYYTSMRLDVTGRNMSELNMTCHPEFLPLLGTARGGNAKIDWYMQYLTEDELNKWPNQPAHWGWYGGGWIISLNGTATMDKQAALAVLNVTSAGFDDFANWWTSHEKDVEDAYRAWLLEEGNHRLDIYNMYEYQLTFLIFNLSAQKVADNIVLTYDIAAFGMEALMTRWLHEAFMPTEWYFEDFRFNATIGPDMADLDISTVVEYAAYAWESIQTSGEPCWVWEGMLQDCVGSFTSHPKSDFAPYDPLTYMDSGPGSAWYGQYMSYRHTPGAFNLSAGEMMSFEWPSGQQQFIINIAPETIDNVSFNMTVKYPEPADSDLPGQVVVDANARTITLTGPIDMWTWSKDQTAHAWLAGEWSRVGLLPHGMPYIEFARAA